MLVRAFGMIANELAGWDLIIAGDGPERHPLESLSQTSCPAGRVTFVGRADRATTARLFRGCQMFVLPSRHEPFGIVNIEAMAAGKPVIATAVGGVPEIITDGQTGLLVAPEDPEQLCRAILRLASDVKLREMLSRRALKAAEKFEWASVADDYIRVYEAVTRGAVSRAQSTAAPGDATFAEVQGP